MGDPARLGISASAVARAVGGYLVGPDVRIDDVVIDSRCARRGSLFVALEGTRTDGHRFVGEAFGRGATAALVEGVRLDAAMRGTHVVARDVAAALLDLGRWWRSRLDAVAVGITGSVGKTTTKDLVASALADAFEVVASPRSYNNAIGVPLTVLAARPTTRRLVCEIGAGAVGEIASLCEVVRPRIGVVTVVGPAHLETFGSLERIARAKSELVRALPADGIAILNADDPVVASFAERTGTPARVVTYGRSPRVDVRATEVAVDADGRASFVVRAGGERAEVHLALVGEHMVTPALAALACARVEAIELERAAIAIGGVAAREGRMRIAWTGDRVRVLDDTYNANPVSMRAAVDALASVAARSRVAVLGPMEQLGASSLEEHERLGRLVAAQRIDRLVTVGEGAGPIAAGASRAGMPPERISETGSIPEAFAAVRGVAGAGDVVLVKASRAAGLDGLVRALVEGEPALVEGEPQPLGAGLDGMGIAGSARRDATSPEGAGYAPWTMAGGTAP